MVMVKMNMARQRRGEEGFGAIFGGYTDSKKEIGRIYALKGGGYESFRSISWEDAKKRSDKVMVLADPGMGKTTLLKMEAARKAQQEISKLENCEYVEKPFFASTLSKAISETKAFTQ